MSNLIAKMLHFLVLCGQWYSDNQTLYHVLIWDFWIENPMLNVQYRQVDSYSTGLLLVLIVGYGTYQDDDGQTFLKAFFNSVTSGQQVHWSQF